MKEAKRRKKNPWYDPDDPSKPEGVHVEKGRIWP
jgi:hypothetical protein